MDYGDMSGYNYGNSTQDIGGAGQFGTNPMYGGSAINSSGTGYTGTGGVGSPMRSQTSHPIIPIVVSMINRVITHQEGSFKYFDADITTVSLCGIVSSYKSGASDRRSFIIHDGTGVIQADFYVQDNHFTDIIDGYVRIIGSLREFQGRVAISGYHIAPVFDLNEMTCHYLDCIQCYLYYSKRNGSSTSGAMTSSDTNNQNGEGVDLESKILKFVRDRKNATSGATSITDILNTMKMQGYSEDSINYAVNVLEQSMQLYQTDPNFYITDN